MAKPIAAAPRAGLVASLVLTAAALGGCGPAANPDKAPGAAANSPGAVDLARVQNVASEPGAWLTGGRDAGKTHYSPLDQINRETVSRLGFAWELQTGTSRGMQATPIVVDGVMYTTGVAGRVYALDAATGKVRWQFEPNVDLKNARSACCDLVNRGLAVWKGRIYVAAFDGILYSLDAADGKVLWQADTITDRRRAYSVTGAPQVAGKVVVIGNGGAEFDSRGYVTAYDLETGKQVWRFFTVPGDPKQPYENQALEMAAATWKDGDYWTHGGGGNAWDSINYDAETNLVYFGTANGAPWSRTKRSPGGGDNLFLASIVALNADTGEYAWHYQTTPGERWDYDATPHLMLATLKWGGQDRKVVMQASKNGFFYVLDRKTGELLAADPFVATTWAKSVDLKTGRPLEDAKAADYSDGEPKLIFPSSVGGHNFNPMSLSPRTGLVYIPSVHSGMVLMEGPKGGAYLPGRINTGVQVGFSAQLLAPQSLPPAMRKLADPAFLKTQPDVLMSASLKAWDPVNRKVVWEFRNSSFMDHGGVLSTGGGLVVQGGLDGKLKVFNDETGALLKEIEVGTAMIAAPMTYTVDGVQYIALVAGSGGGGWNLWFPENIASKNGNANRILAFRLDGGPTPVPAALPDPAPLPEPPAQAGTLADIRAGGALFGANCGSCHGNAPRAPVPDLRGSAVVREAAAFQGVVRGGALQPRGMPRWDDLLSEAEVEKIRAYLISITREAYAEQQKALAKQPPAPAQGLSQGHL
jgi:quinohemoprotein ethanol dehydrogenase